MARIRSIKPELFLHEKLAELSITHRYFFVGLWTLADRDGYLEDRPKRIKAELLPWDDVDVDALLNDLHSAGFVVRYEAEGVHVLCIPKFHKHQKPHPKEKSHGLPKPSPAGKLSGKPEKDGYLPGGVWDLGSGIRDLGSGEIPPATLPGGDGSQTQTPSGSEPTRKRGRKTKATETTEAAEPTGDHAKVMAAFHDAFLAVRGFKPVLNGRSGKAVKELISKLGVDKACKVVEVAFADDYWRGRIEGPWDVLSHVNRWLDKASGVPSDERGPYYVVQADGSRKWRDDMTCYDYGTADEVNAMVARGFKIP